MHKRNIFIIALIISAIITGVFYLTPSWSQSLFFAPAVILAVLFSNNPHNITFMAGNSAFLTYALLYVVIFVIVYALLLELYLLRQVLHHIDEARNDLAKGETHPAIYLRRVGNAMTELERRRRKHWVLRKLDDLDLTQDPQTLAANAIVKAGGTRQVKRLLRHLEGHIAASRGSETASSMMLEITRHAHTLAGHKEQESSHS